MKNDDFLRQNSSTMYAAAYANEVTAATVTDRIDVLSLNHQAAITDGDLSEDTTSTLSDRATTSAHLFIRDQGTAIGFAQANALGKWRFTTENELQTGKQALQMLNTGDVVNNSAPVSHMLITSTEPHIVAPTQHTGIDETVSAMVYEEATPLPETDNIASEKPLSESASSSMNIPTFNDVVGNTESSGEQIVSNDSVNDTVENLHVRGLTPEFTGMTTDNGIETHFDSPIEDPRPLFNGEAEAGSAVEIFDNGKLMGTTFADETGKWEFVPFDDLEPGKHSFVAEVAGIKSQPFVISVDLPEPAVSIQLIDLFAEPNEIFLPQITPIDEMSLQLSITPEDMIWETPYDRITELLNVEHSFAPLVNEETLHCTHTQ